jgi:hypothetical protein
MNQLWAIQQVEMLQQICIADVAAALQHCRLRCTDAQMHHCWTQMLVKRLV